MSDVLSRKIAPRRRPPSTVRAGGYALGLVALVFAVLASGRLVSLGAQAPTLTVTLEQIDGTPTFDSSDGPGLDSSATNGIVRTNDTITYNVEVRVNDAPSTDVTFSLELSQGLEFPSIPPYCDAATSSLVPPSLPAPQVPTTSSSWTTLPTQTLNCNVGARTAFSTFTYPVVTRVRPEIPNGTTLAPVVARATSADVSVPVSSNELTVDVSARPKFNLAKNSISQTENRGYFSTSGLVTCADGSGRTCQQYVFPMLISTTPEGKGASPLDGPVTWQDDLSVASFYGAAVLSDPDYIAAGAAAPSIYGAILNGCRTLHWSQPYVAISGTTTATNSVRDSGTTTCTQPGGPGTPVEVSVTGMDSTAYTVPTESSRPTGLALPSNRGYVYSYAVTVQIPVIAALDLGIENNGVYTLNWRNALTDFEAVGFDGTPNDPTGQEPFDDYRASTFVASTSGSMNNWFVGVPGTPGNVPPVQFSPGWAVTEGPSGGTGTYTGQGQLFPGERTVSNILHVAKNGTTGEDVTYFACNGWDNAQLQLSNEPVPGSTVANGQLLPSNGAPVWVASYNRDGYAYPGGAITPPPIYVEYGTGTVGAGLTCDDADSPDGWHTNPAAVPGNDPVQAAAGVFTAVTRVRYHVVMGPHTRGTGSYLWMGVGLDSTPGMPVGTIIPTYVAGKVRPGTHTFADMNDPSLQAWRSPTYDPATNSGSFGDRLFAGGAIVRLSKEVRDPGSSNWVTSTPAVTGGQTVDFRLSPTLTSAFQGAVTVPVIIEDCLPTGAALLSATVQPSVVQAGAPTGVGLACGANETYVRWDLPSQALNAAITPIEYSVSVSPTVNSGLLTNQALVSTPSDTSDESERLSEASVQSTQPSGVALDKVTLTPVIEINRPGESAPDVLRWAVELVNIETTPPPSDADIIDILPEDGLGVSAFDGTLTFVSATITQGGSAAEMLYTATPATALVSDPAHASNDAATGSTVWCSAPAGGAVVAGAGTATDCPAGPTDVTGLRARRAGDFGPGDRLSFEIEMLPEANSANKLYVNQAVARVVGVALPVGPVVASATIVDSSISDSVWHDVNGNGIQDTGDLGIAGVSVALAGVDSDGNPVSSTTVTDASGNYIFDELQSGNYDVTFSLPGPLNGNPAHFTVADAGTDDALDSDGDPTTGIASVSLQANADDTSVDQGVFYPDPSISIVKHINGDDANSAPGTAVSLGSQMSVTFDVENTGNTILESIVVADDVIATAAITCPATSLQPGDTMQCTATTPAPSFGQLHVNTATAEGEPAPLADGTQLPVVTDDDLAHATSFGSAIGGQVFHDLDNDGALTSGDSPIAGVTITLTGTDINGLPVNLQTTTDANGEYVFGGLVAGTYTVTESQPSAYNDGIDTAGSLGGDATVDDTISDIVLSDGEQGTDYDFAEVGTYLEGVVWIDDDADQAISNGETVPLGGVEIILLDANGNEVARTTTASDGTYRFENLLAGDYTVVQTQPQGYGSTTSNTIDVELPLTGLEDVNFGEVLGSIGGVMFEDSNVDGVQGSGEPNAGAGHIVELFDADGVLVATTTTDANGEYLFDHLLVGDYSVTMTPSGMVFTLENSGADDTVDSDADWGTGMVSNVQVGLSGDLVDHVRNVDGGIVDGVNDLAISKALVRASSIEVGGEATFRLEVTNPAENPVLLTELRDVMPEGMVLLRHTADEGWDCDLSETALTCLHEGVLAAGAAAPPIHIVVRVDRSGVTDNTASVTSLMPGLTDGDESNNTSTASVTATSAPPVLAFTGMRFISLWFFSIGLLFLGSALIVGTRTPTAQARINARSRQ